MTKRFGATELSNSPGAYASKLRLVEGPLDLSWHHCGTTSEFLGTFYAVQAETARLDANETRHSISYLANELLENAVKFRAPGDILIESSLEGANFEIKVSNMVEASTAERFQTLLAELTARDPGDLLIEKIEANAADPSSSGSGLGLLTLMSDYGARLGWVFKQTEEGGQTRLETYAALTLS